MPVTFVGVAGSTLTDAWGDRAVRDVVERFGEAAAKEGEAEDVLLALL